MTSFTHAEVLPCSHPTLIEGCPLERPLGETRLACQGISSLAVPVLSLANNICLAEQGGQGQQPSASPLTRTGPMHNVPFTLTPAHNKATLLGNNAPSVPTGTNALNIAHDPCSYYS